MSEANFIDDCSTIFSDDVVNEILVKEIISKGNLAIWEMKNGHIIAIKDMSTKHLVNTIRMINNQEWGHLLKNMKIRHH